MTSFSPREIVSELDRFIVGQQDAKRAVAIALRNRQRRKKLPPSLAADVGTAINGRIIDLWFPSTAEARAWGRRTVTITVYR
jgi:ATP-dependent protease HslVU (ClpYQ) ATPase subunit